MTAPHPKSRVEKGRTSAGPVKPAKTAAPRASRPQPVSGSKPFAKLKKEIWVWLEVEDGACPAVCWELVGRARMLADQAGANVRGILLGEGVSHSKLIQQAIRSGADAVSVADHPHLREYTTTPYTKVMEELIKHHQPDTLLIGATHNGRDLAGRLAVRVKTGLTADCTDLEWDVNKGLLKSWVVGFGGGIAACIVCPETRPQMATARPGVFPVPRETARTGEVDQVPKEWVGPAAERVLERHRKEQKNISGAEVLVVGGRGVGGRFDLVHQLAAHLGGEVGATRVAVDAGWITREHQIGQTGVVTHPEMTLVFGASGATSFTVGIDKSGTIVSVNNDPSAQMNAQADYIIEGDAAAVMTALLQRIHAGGKTSVPHASPNGHPGSHVKPPQS